MVDELPGDARAREALDRVLREEPGRILSVLAHAIGDIDLAEDALHDAGVAALERWPRDGVPSNPAGWVVTTARRKAIDRLRRVAVERRKHAEIAALTHLVRDPHLAVEEGTLGDERRAADMLRRLGRLADAEAAYRAALRLTENGSERLHLERRIRECRPCDQMTRSHTGSGYWSSEMAIERSSIPGAASPSHV